MRVGDGGHGRYGAELPKLSFVFFFGFFFFCCFCLCCHGRVLGGEAVKLPNCPSLDWGDVVWRACRS